jgi:hypothetical protein
MDVMCLNEFGELVPGHQFSCLYYFYPSLLLSTTSTAVYCIYYFVRKFNQNWSKTAEFGYVGPVLIEFSPWPKAM